MGPRAGPSSRLRLPGVLLALLVAVDHATKLAALALLPRGEEVDWGAAFQLVLRFNESGINSWTRALAGETDRAEIAAGAPAYLALGAALLAVRGWKRSRGRKALVCIGAFLLGGVAGEGMLPWLRHLGDWELQAFGLASVTAFVVAVWWLVPRGLWKTTLALFAATGLGNLLSLLYPPFRVVDFLYSRLLQESVGFGVCNLADLCYLAGIGFLAWATLRAVGRRLFGRRGRRRPTRAAMPGSE